MQQIPTEKWLDEVKQSSALLLHQRYVEELKEASDLLQDMTEQGDFVMTYLEQRKRNEVQQEESKTLYQSTTPISLKIPQVDLLKARTAEDMLTRLTAEFDDPKYSIENQMEAIGDRAAEFNQQKTLQKKFEAMKASQREKFFKYQTEDIKEEILALDSELRENFQYKFQYSQGGRTKEIEVKYYDIQKLNPPNYLNDTIINFYLKVLEMLIVPEELRSRVYVFNTYFMDKLCPYEKVNLIPQTDTQRLSDLFSKTYESVKKWVKEDLFQYEYLLFPLNLPEHWSLIYQIASHPQCILDNEKKDKACILYLDSFGIIDQRLISIVKMYLHKNHQEKNPTALAYSESPVGRIPAIQSLVPRQINYIDCGAFLLEYAESFLSRPEYLLDDTQVSECVL